MAAGTVESVRWEAGTGRAWLPTYDIDRPHVRLGMCWFAAVMAAVVASPVVGGLGLAMVYGSAALVAGLQTARRWAHVGARPNRVVAGCAAAAMPVATALGDHGLGSAILLAVGASVLTVGGSGADVCRDGGWTVRCWLFAGLAAASVVAVYRIDPWAAIALIVLISAFESGDYLFGAEARSPLVGWLAGGVATAVATFSLFAISVAPFDGSQVFVFGTAVAVLVPVGQLMGSAVLPDGRALASGLRRLDSLLVLGPAWVVGLWMLHA